MTESSALQETDDREIGHWFRCELRDGNIVYLQNQSGFVWANHPPLPSLQWRAVEIASEPAG